MLRAFKIRIHPTEDQAHFLNGQFGAVRFVYNRALRIKEHYRKFHDVNLSITKDIRPLIAIAKKGHKYGTEHDRDDNAARNIREQGLIKLMANGHTVEHKVLSGVVEDYDHAVNK